jgi:hypothetical protein
MSRPGIARGVETRIGQLLGPAKRDHDRSAGATSVVTDIARMDRSDFRVLAKALDGEVEVAPLQAAGSYEKSLRVGSMKTM